MMPAYTVYGWKYEIKIYYNFCESDYYTSSSVNSTSGNHISKVCNIKILNGQSNKVSSAVQPIIFEVPSGSQTLILNISDITDHLKIIASPENFVFSLLNQKIKCFYE